MLRAVLGVEATGSLSALSLVPVLICGKPRLALLCFVTDLSAGSAFAVELVAFALSLGVSLPSA